MSPEGGERVAGGERALEILEPGLLALVEDAGRFGHMAVGVGRSGAADQGSYALANRLLGNAAGAAAVEVTLGGMRVRARGDLTIALTGAAAEARVQGRRVAHTAVVRLASGADLTLGIPRHGLRSYLAVRGGLAVEPVLGSRSSDTMSGLGPPALAAGMVLPVGTAVVGVPEVDHAPVAASEGGVTVLRVTAGPRRDWFVDPERTAAASWHVSEQSDRRGVRLVGPPLVRRPDRREVELASEGMVRGAIQVPASGQPVILLNDHPVTGGYPVIGVVRAADVDLVAQLSAGQEARLIWDGVREGTRAYE